MTIVKSFFCFVEGMTIVKELKIKIKIKDKFYIANNTFSTLKIVSSKIKL